MILNRLIFPQGNKITFTLNHTENGKPYALEEGEQYYIMISSLEKDFPVVQTAFSPDNCFSIDTSIAPGEYVFEIGIVDFPAGSRVILPALDERDKPLNQLFILKKLYV